MDGNLSKKYIIIALVLVVVFALGYLIGSYLNEGDQDNNINNGANNGINVNSDLGSVKLFAVLGVVNEVNNNSLIVEAEIPYSEQGSMEKEVVVDSNTKIILKTRKSREEFDRELREYEENPDASVNPPSIYTEESISVSDISSGDKVTIESNENIRDSRKINAKRIVKLVDSPDNQ